MSRKKPKDQAASIRQRLLNLARAHKEDFLITLIRFGIERLMYRLSKSKWKAFLKRSNLSDHKMELSDIANNLCTFLMPPTKALRLKKQFQKVWKPGGPWR